MVLLNPDGNWHHDALAVLDVTPTSSTYNRLLGRAKSLSCERGRKRGDLSGV